MSRERLREMIPVWLEEIQEVVQGLDEGFHVCACCKFRVKHNFRDHQVAEHLRAFATKLRRWEQEPVTQVQEPLADEGSS